MKLQPGTLYKAYLYLATWRNLEDGKTFKTYIAHTNTLALLSDVAAQLEHLHSDTAFLTAIKETGDGYILTDRDQDHPKEAKSK